MPLIFAQVWPSVLLSIWLSALFAPMAFFGSAYAAGLCVDAAGPKHAIEAKHGQWTQLTPEQWQFLRGVYAMNPLTPPGLPYGDKAALVRIDGQDNGLVFFIDGDQVCTPMPVPKQLLALLDDVATGKVTHEGQGM